ncbi:DNA topoisomerase IV subunit B [Pseudomonas aeruginosa]|nr:DNA topoisomerase IV subunit B [Pseudomonas aeruginosa]
MRRLLAILGLFGGLVQAAEAPPEPPVPAALSFISEHAVEGMRGGNLSGLAWCGGALWTVSDRDDDRLYRLQPSAEGSDQPWQAEAESFIAPTPPDSGLPWGMSTRVWLSGLVRGGNLDFEGIACDAAGNRYLVSEAHAAVLQLPVSGAPNWLRLPPGLLPQARASGMLMNFNALFEGSPSTPRASASGWLPSASAAACWWPTATTVPGAARAAAYCSPRAQDRAAAGTGQRAQAAEGFLRPRLLPRQAVHPGAPGASDLPPRPGPGQGRTLLVVRLGGPGAGASLRAALWRRGSPVAGRQGRLAGHRQWRPCARRWRRAALRPALRRARRRLVGDK